MTAPIEGTVAPLSHTPPAEGPVAGEGEAEAGADETATGAVPDGAAPLLSVSELSVSFGSGRRFTQVVDRVSMTIGAGERVGVIGESGSGKTVTALSILGLHDLRRTRYAPGSSIRFDGRELLNLSGRELLELRGKEIAIVFQDPTTSLNPVFTIGRQLTHVIRVHQSLGRKDARAAATEALRDVQIRQPERVLDAYPHELSGGMRQRVLIAMAIACRPRLLIADEPTSALDVTVQAVILELLDEIVTSRKTALLLITHDMGVIARLCTSVHVMYAGRVVERGPVGDLFRDARHPYTKGLLASTPRLNEPRPHRLVTVAGGQSGAGVIGPGAGCAFAARCPYAIDRCRVETPELLDGGSQVAHEVACHRWREIRAASAGETESPLARLEG
jgi:peptide/nickel transport system ATP-binding protein